MNETTVCYMILLSFCYYTTKLQAWLKQLYCRGSEIYIKVKACSYFQISFTTMKVFLLCALFGAALSEVFFEEKFDDGDAWTKR